MSLKTEGGVKPLRITTLIFKTWPQLSLHRKQTNKPDPMCLVFFCLFVCFLLFQATPTLPSWI